MPGQTCTCTGDKHCISLAIKYYRDFIAMAARYVQLGDTKSAKHILDKLDRVVLHSSGGSLSAGASAILATICEVRALSSWNALPYVFRAWCCNSFVSLVQQNRTFVDQMAAVQISHSSTHPPECMPDPAAFIHEARPSSTRTAVPASINFKKKYQPLRKSPVEARRNQNKKAHELAQTKARKRPRLRLVRDSPRQQVTG